MKHHNFRNLKVWQLAIELVKEVYLHTNSFPEQEKFGLSSQIRRSAVSVPSNIAEGSAKSSEKDFNPFLEMSLGSSFELETQLLIAKELNLLKEEAFSDIEFKLHEVQRMIVGLTKSLKGAI